MLYKKTEKLSIIKREGEIMGMFVNPNAAAFQCAVNSEVYRQNGIIGIYK